jgi:hypothetical protein
MSSKILLIVLLLLGLSLALASGRAYAMAQITMVNRSQLTLYLYIDGNFGCGPVGGLGRFTNSPGLFCTSSVTPGPHRLEARDGEKVMMHADNVNIGDGTSPVWTVTIEDPDQALIKQLDGARYLCTRQYSQYATGEHELTIKGTTLIFRQRFIWMSPNFEPPRKGIGNWGSSEERMPITGRKAERTLMKTRFTYTVSEDGNSITEQSSEGTFTYYRQ